MKGGLKEHILLRAMWKKGTTAAAHQNEFVHDHKVCKKVYRAQDTLHLLFTTDLCFILYFVSLIFLMAVA
jgi:hypothetical protein